MTERLMKPDRQLVASGKLRRLRCMRSDANEACFDCRAQCFQSNYILITIRCRQCLQPKAFQFASITGVTERYAFAASARSQAQPLPIRIESNTRRSSGLYGR